MRYVKIICRIAELGLNLLKVLGGNWAAIFALVVSAIELREAFRQAPVAA